MGRLDGKVALVTGASAGIGAAIAWELARGGADVAINYLTYPEEAQALAKKIADLGRRVLLYQLDVSDPDAVERMIGETAEQLGRLDIVVANAANSVDQFFYEADMADFHRVFNVTLWGAFYCFRAGARILVKQGQGGHLIAIGSPHALEALPSSMAYNMAKAAIDQMVRTAALELAPNGIRVNVIHPGWTDTPGEHVLFNDETLAAAGAALPLGRLARPEEIARGVSFLVDPENTYITGSTLAIDGGYMLPWWSKRGAGEF
ncbi:SDR family oxidoreductase [soil metagenome]